MIIELCTIHASFTKNTEKSMIFQLFEEILFGNFYWTTIYWSGGVEPLEGGSGRAHSGLHPYGALFVASDDVNNLRIVLIFTFFDFEALDELISSFSPLS